MSSSDAHPSAGNGRPRRVPVPVERLKDFLPRPQLRRPRGRLARGRKLEQVHTWQFEQLASSQGLSEGYVTYLETVAIDLRRAARLPRPQSIKAIGKFLSDGETCLACRLLRDDEVIQRQHFLAYIATTDGQEFYRRSLGLCLPHLQAVLADKPPRKIGEFLLLEQARHFEGSGRRHAQLYFEAGCHSQLVVEYRRRECGEARLSPTRRRTYRA